MTNGKVIFNTNSGNASVFGASQPVYDFTKHPIVATAGIKVSPNKENVFGGKFDKVLLGMYITRVIYQAPATIVFWSDGTKTTSKAQHGDVYNKETGLTICVLKKLVGGDQVANLFKDWVVEENQIDLKSIRLKKKEVNMRLKAAAAKLAEDTEEVEPVVKKRGRPRKESV